MDFGLYRISNIRIQICNTLRGPCDTGNQELASQKSQLSFPVLRMTGAFYLDKHSVPST